jgi:lipid-A-disaccharide synthase
LSTDKTIRILAVAGEASGDRLAARALKNAKEIANSKDLSLDIYGIGGNQCKEIGMDCVYSVEEMSVVGFFEVARRYNFFRKVFKNIVSFLDSSALKPDILFLIDYPGFNLRLAREAHKRGIRVVFYVSPQVWAWKASRVKDIVATVDDMIVIFPFEVDIYKKAGLANTHFVGHPLLEIITEEKKFFSSREAFAQRMSLDGDTNWLLIFPGSRNEEVAKHLDTMISAAAKFCSDKNWQPIVVESESVSHRIYENANVQQFRSAKDIHELMFHSQLGILKSGTTTLEAALMGLPGVICYKTSAVTYQIAKRMITLPFIGLANIVLGKKLYPELLQSEFSVERITESLEFVNNEKDLFIAQLKEAWKILEAPSDSPSNRVAEILLGNA